MTTQGKWTGLAVAVLLLVAPSRSVRGQGTDDSTVQGLRSRSAGGSTVKIGTGFARDSTGAELIVVPRGTTRMIDLTTVGLGGLDQGAVAANSSYALWIVRTVEGAVGAMASKSFSVSAVAFPAGAKFRRIGSFATGDTGDVLAFRQLGTSGDREVWYAGPREALDILSDGGARSSTFVPFGSLAPVTLERVFLYVVPDGTAVTISTSSSPPLTLSTPQVLPFLDGPGQGLDYHHARKGGLTDVFVLGYAETL